MKYSTLSLYFLDLKEKKKRKEKKFKREKKILAFTEIN